jgi:hypothetical protein
MKSKALYWLGLLPMLVILLWLMNPIVVIAHREGQNPATTVTDIRLNSTAKATPTPSHPVTPTPLPAIYRVQQTHPGMIIGAGVLVLIILVGVLAFSRHKE